jgi:DNA primase large subunit
MDRRHARYPFLPAAREAVAAAEEDVTAAATEDAVLERARDRVQRAITDGTSGRPHASTRIELLSYPVARMLVSSIDEPALTRKYAAAEARTALERLAADLVHDADASSEWYDAVKNADWLAYDPDDSATLRSDRGDGGRIRLSTVLGGVDLTDLERAGDHFRLDVCTYLDHAADRQGEAWRLTRRALDDGFVPVAHEEVLRILEGVVQERVAADLPLTIPDDLDASLETATTAIREHLGEYDLTRFFEGPVERGAFPPCMAHLVERVQAGESLEDPARFSLASFLAAAGMDETEVGAIATDEDVAERLRYAAERVVTEAGPVEYAPPGCLTMDAYGDCVNKDERCERIDHPLQYYEDALPAYR